MQSVGYGREIGSEKKEKNPTEQHFQTDTCNADTIAFRLSFFGVSSPE